jgi:hypothetical protein
VRLGRESVGVDCSVPDGARDGRIRMDRELRLTFPHLTFLVGFQGV